MQFVGEKTAAVLTDEGHVPNDISEKRLSYTQLVDAGVNSGVAARIRRSYSLPWSFESNGTDLERRSTQVRGLGEAERAWVAASTGDWADATARADTAARLSTAESPSESESTWTAPPKPTPLAVLDSLDTESTTRLKDAGIRSVRRLATVDPIPVAKALDLPAATVRSWHEAARAHR